MEVRKLLDSLVAELSQVGLLLIADQTVILTRQSQPPSTITTDHGRAMSRRNGWFAFSLRTDRNKNFWTGNSISSKWQKHIMPTNGIWKTEGSSFFSNFAILMLLFHRLFALQVGIVPGTKKNIQTLDIHFRKFCRSIVGLSQHIDWTLGWHEILHIWNKHFAGVAKIPSRSGICCAYWKLATHIAKFPIHHWIQKVFIRQPVGRRWLGRPKHRWDSKLAMSLPKNGSLGGHCARLWIVGQYLNGMKEKCSAPHGVQA